MKYLQTFGSILVIASILIFIAMLGMGTKKINLNSLPGNNEHQNAAITQAIDELGATGKEVNHIGFVSLASTIIDKANDIQEANFKTNGAPEGVGEWDFRFGGNATSFKQKLSSTALAQGPVQSNPWLFFFLTFGLAIIGGLFFIIPKFSESAGIKHDGIYHSSLTSGLKLGLRTIVLSAGIIGVLVYGYVKEGNLFWPLVTTVVGILFIYFVFIKEKSKGKDPQRSASPANVAWLGIIAGILLVGFYILLYWRPEFIQNWVDMVSPISEMLNGGKASRWFLYGLLYTVIMAVMGIRMLAKYQHNKYQRIRTYSVMFFQTAFAFLIPQMISKLNATNAYDNPIPAPDLKNMWPLDYSFFFNYRLDEMVANGSIGIFMLVWGIALFVIGVPVFVYFFGKRWYCSWVCGCGGLAETLGDPWRQISDKSLRAWQFERYIIHGVMVAVVLMTIGVLYTYFTNSYSVLGINTDSLKSWYGFFIGAGFAGIVGTGFYPLMGNRTWCRFGCPLAGYLGLVQKFKSRFRITTNGSQCISCGNCSTYCEMGIDVRSYAQKGQDIVRSSCVGCGVCSAVCPRGVLKLENASGDIATRTDVERTIHVTDLMA